MFFIIYNVVISIKWIPHGTMKNINTIKLVTSLGFHPRNDSFNCEIFDVGQFRLHVMNWQSLTQMSFAENELQTNEPVSTVLQSFPDDVDGRSRLPPFCYIFFQPKAGSDSRLINPSHLFSMSSSANPNLLVLQQIKIYNSRMGQLIVI